MNKTVNRPKAGLIMSTSASDCYFQLVTEEIFNKCLEAHNKDWDFSNGNWKYELLDEIFEITGGEEMGNIIKWFGTQEFVHEKTPIFENYNIIGILPFPNF
jgi:hypothetical protein